MNFLLLVTLLASLVATVYSAITQQEMPVLPGYEDKCYDRVDDHFYKRGEVMKWRLKGCGRMVCGGPTKRSTAFVEITTCDKFTKVPAECFIEVNPNLAYPDCCERLVCPGA